MSILPCEVPPIGTMITVTSRDINGEIYHWNGTIDGSPVSWGYDLPDGSWSLYYASGAVTSAFVAVRKKWKRKAYRISLAKNDIAIGWMLKDDGRREMT